MPLVIEVNIKKGFAEIQAFLIKGIQNRQQITILLLGISTKIIINNEYINNLVKVFFFFYYY